MRGIGVCMLMLALLASGAARADSSSPELAAYYDRQMAIVAGKVYAWQGSQRPTIVPVAAKQVGVGRMHYYALTKAGNLLRFTGPSAQRTVLMRGVAKFAAGDSGVLAITDNNVLWWLNGTSRTRLADDVLTAAVGDGANYYITLAGELFVKGRAHRGQYGDGRLKATDEFVRTASGAAYVTAHTGHAILLLRNGDVMGTGGNIFGPVGRHGLGDKAVRWSKIAHGAKAIATGASHSLAILTDDTLIAWGRDYGTAPASILEGVVAVAAGSQTTIARKRDGSLWQWSRGQTPWRVPLTE